MKVIGCSIYLMLFAIVACTQERQGNKPVYTETKIVSVVPFLTKRGDFVYVDRITLKPVHNRRYRSASVFTPSGFAVVGNDIDEYAIIDKNGDMVMDYADQEIDLNVVNGLTFYKKEIEYEKKMPFYKWDWNILGGGIKKDQTYHKTKIGIVETDQILLKKDVPYLENYFSAI